MGRRSHTRRLDVWMNGELTGHWSLTPVNEEFVYADGWRASKAARPISLSLPFLPDNKPYKGAVVHSYFENLLPDSKLIRDRLAQRFKAGSADAFDLLEQIGRDCVGALQIMRDGVRPEGVFEIREKPLDESGVARILAAAVSPSTVFDSRDETEEAETIRISLAGAQEKTALLWHNGKWRRPLGATPTTHIFKLPLGRIGNMNLDMRLSVENEWLCSKIVEAYGLDVAHCDIASFEGRKVLIVTRFDRTRSRDGSWIVRLPQEDMCQAFAIPPHLRYEADGGPGIEKICRLLGASETSIADQRTLFKAQVVFWLLRAPDGHAKNFSIRLLPGGTFRLTPLYDVLSAYPILGRDPEQISPQRVRLAMAVRSGNAHWRMKDILRRHWNAIAGPCGLGASAEALLTEITDATPRVIDRVRNQLPPDFPAPLADSVLDGLREQSTHLAGMPAGKDVMRILK